MKVVVDELDQSNQSDYISNDMKVVIARFQGILIILLIRQQSLMPNYSFRTRVIRIQD